MEPLRTSNNQSDPEQKKKNQRHYTPDFGMYPKGMVIKTHDTGRKQDTLTSVRDWRAQK